MPAIKFTGPPGQQPDTMRPGGMPPPAGPVGDRIQRDNEAQANWERMGAPGGVQDALASNAMRNQQATGQAVRGYGTSGLGYSQQNPITPNMGMGGGSGLAGINPFNVPLNFAPMSAGWLLRDLDQAEHQVASNIGRMSPGGFSGWSGFGGAGGGTPPSGLPPWAGGFGGWGGGGGYGGPGGGKSPGGNAPGAFGGWGGPPGSGGGGGGGFNFYNFNYPGQNQPGGGGGGGGGGGRGNLPFAGTLGLGTTGGLIGGAIGIGIASKIIEEIAFLPQHLMSLEGTALGSAAPYWNYRTQSAGLARGGGFAGEGLGHQFYQGINPPDWMKRLGLGPQQSLDLMQGFGITPGNDGESQKLVEQLGSMRFMPAFGGLPSGQAEKSAGLFSKYGIFSDTGARSPYFDDGPARERGMGIAPFNTPAGQVAQYSAQMIDIMARAQELGLNRSEVMRSIDSTLQTAVTHGGGVGYTPQSLGNELLRYSSLPGGRTGEVGANMIAAASQFGQGVGSAPLPTIAYAGLAQRLQSESDITKYTEKTDPGFMERIKRNPATAILLQQYLQARKDKNPAAAAQLLSSLMNQSPSLPMRIAGEEGAAGSFTGYQHTLAVGNSINVDPLTVIAGGIGAPGGTMNTDRAQQARAYYIARGWSPAQATGIAAYYAEETGGSFNPRAFNPKGGSQGAQGAGQWRGSRITDFTRLFGHGPMDPNVPENQLFQEQLQFGQWELTHTESAAGEAVRKTTSGAAAATTMVEQFGRPGTDIPKADNSAIAYANHMDTSADFTGLPPDMLRTQAAGQAGVMGGSQVSAWEAEALIDRFNKAVQYMIDGLTKGSQILQTMPPMSPNPYAESIG